MLSRTLIAALLGGCTGALVMAAASSSPPPASSATSGHAQIGSFGLDLAGGDPSVKPGDDFARHANGRWLDTAQIPPDRASWGTFAMLRERSLQQLREILEALPKDSPAGSNEQKLGDFYRAYLDTDAIDRAGLAPARAGLDAIAAAKTHEDLARLMGRPDLRLTAPLAFGIAPDEKDPEARADERRDGEAVCARVARRDSVGNRVRRIRVRVGAVDRSLHLGGST